MQSECDVYALKCMDPKGTVWYTFTKWIQHVSTIQMKNEEGL